MRLHALVLVIALVLIAALAGGWEWKGNRAGAAPAVALPAAAEAGLGHAADHRPGAVRPLGWTWVED